MICRQITNRIRVRFGRIGEFSPAVVGEMLHQGFTPDEIVKVGGGNFCRVFGKVTAGHA